VGERRPDDPGPYGKLWSVVGISLLVLLYAGFSGLWGVVATDFFQFFLGLFGAIVVAIAAVSHVGGMGALITQVQTEFGAETLAMVPLRFGDGGWVRWSETAGISASTFWPISSYSGGPFAAAMAAGSLSNDWPLPRPRRKRKRRRGFSTCSIT
jgi:Na+/proline symporter